MKNVATIVFQAREVVQYLTAAIGNLTARNLSTERIAKKIPERIAQVLTKYHDHLYKEEKISVSTTKYQRELSWKTE